MPSRPTSATSPSARVRSCREESFVEPNPVPSIIGNMTLKQLMRLDRWFLVVGIALVLVGFVISLPAFSWLLLIAGGLCVGVSSFLNLAAYAKKRREGR